MITSSTRLARFAGAALLATAGLLACGGEEQMRPQTPGTTTTTSATASTNPSVPEGASGAGTAGMPEPVPATSDVPQGAPVGDVGIGDDGSPATVPVAAPVVAVVAPGALNDAEIIASLKASSRTILAQSREAMKKGASARVRQLAELLLESHARVESRLDAALAKEALTLQENPTSDAIRQRGEQVMAGLRASLGASFDRSYVGAEADEQTKLLDLIDRAATQVQGDALRSALSDLRPQIAECQRAAADARASISH